MEVMTRPEATARGLKRYFTGKPCINGHIAERITSNGWCLACASQQKKKNRELYRELTRKWRTQNPEKNREYQRRYRDPEYRGVKWREKARASWRKYCAAHGIPLHEPKQPSRQSRRPKQPATRNCVICQVQFHPHGKQKTCTQKCAHALKNARNRVRLARLRPRKSCIICEKDIIGRRRKACSKECAATLNAMWMLANRERVNASNRRSRLRHLERRLDGMRRWRLANPHWNRDWHRANPEKAQANQQRFRRKKALHTAFLQLAQLKAVPK